MKKITIDDLKELFLSDETTRSFGPTDPDAPTLAEIQESVRSGELKIEFPSQLHVLDLEEEIDKILAAFGIKDAFVTDLSRVSDFQFTEKEMQTAEDELGIYIMVNDYVFQVAQRLKDK